MIRSDPKPSPRPVDALEKTAWRHIRNGLLPVCLLLFHPLAPADPHATATPEQVLQLALEARTAKDYPSMLVLLRQAAEAGEPSAEEMLGSILLAAPSLYGAAVPAQPCEAARWIGLAAAQGSAVGRHQWAVLNGLRDRPDGRHGCAHFTVD